MKPSKNPVYIEFKESSAHVLDGVQGAEFPLEREANGRISPHSSTLLINALRGFLLRGGVLAPRQAICALPARGVTLRTITLPASAKDDPRRLLTMQIEAQFPVAPAELAWGFAQLPAAGDGGAQIDYLVSAVKRDALADYISVLADCGLASMFTVAALVRVESTSPAPADAHLEIGRERSELILFDEGKRPALKVLSWGHDRAGDVESLRSLLPAEGITRLCVSSVHLDVQTLCLNLARTMRVQALPVEPGPGKTAATLGMQRLAEQGTPLLFLGGQEQAAPQFAAPTQWKWPAIAAALLVAAVSLRYAEAMFFQSQVTAKIKELDTYRGTLPKVEKELSFLNYISTNQPPYLDTLAVISTAAPPGTRIDQVSVARRGDLSFRGSVNNPQGPEQFRSKLIDSGFFSKVVVEEQAPAGQDRNKINFRMSAILKPEGVRKLLPPEIPGTNKNTQAGPPDQGAAPPPMSGPMPIPMPMH